MIPKNRTVAPWMRTSISTGYELNRKRNVREMGQVTFYIWLIVIVACLALITTGHHEQDMTDSVNRHEVVSRWDGSQEDIGTAISRELWIMKEAVDSGRHIDALYARH